MDLEKTNYDDRGKSEWSNEHEKISSSWTNSQENHSMDRGILLLESHESTPRDNLLRASSHNSAVARHSSARNLVRILEAYTVCNTDDILDITPKIVAIVRAGRAPSHLFVGPLIDETIATSYADGPDTPDKHIYYTHRTDEFGRSLCINAPPYDPTAWAEEQVPPTPYAPSTTPRAIVNLYKHAHTSYLLNLSHVDFFTDFHELLIAGNDSIIHTCIFYVRLPCQPHQFLFMKRISLTNIVLTQELCDALCYIIVDDLTLTGVAYARLKLTCPSSLNHLALGVYAEKPSYDESVKARIPWLSVDDTRCVHLDRVDILGGCSWKDGSKYVCRSADMIGFSAVLATLRTLSLTIHLTEVLDNSYAVFLDAFASIGRLELRRYVPGTSTFSIVPIINDARSYDPEQPILPSQVDIKLITEHWKHRGIRTIQLDNAFALILPFSTSACWYRMFGAVEWEAPANKCIPITFEQEYPLLFIPHTKEDCEVYNVYVPATHEVDKNGRIELFNSTFLNGSFFLFRCERTECCVPPTSVLIPIHEQPFYVVPKPIVRGLNSDYIASWVPGNPFARNIQKKI